MHLLKTVFVLMLIAHAAVICASERTLGDETQRQKAFLQSLSKIYGSSEVQSRIDTVIRVGDEFKKHRALMGLADQTRYLPALRMFQFKYFRDKRFEEGHWVLEILVDEKLIVNQVRVNAPLKE